MVLDREEQRKSMFLAFEKQKKLIKKRDFLLNSKKGQDKKDALSLTHKIAKLEDFIRNAENKLRMTD